MAIYLTHLFQRKNLAHICIVKGVERKKTRHIDLGGEVKAGYTPTLAFKICVNALIEERCTTTLNKISQSNEYESC